MVLRGWQGLSGPASLPDESRRGRVATAFGASDELPPIVRAGTLADVHDSPLMRSAREAGVMTAWLAATLIRRRNSRIYG